MSDRPLDVLFEAMENVMAGQKAPERYCINCAHFEQNGLLCKRPVLDLVTGQPWTLDLACHTERKQGGGCGVEGRFWKARPTQYQQMGGVKYAEEDDGA